jgi:hypothetical protein
MTHRKHVLFTLVIVMLAVIALSVGTALAGSLNNPALGTDPGPDPGPSVHAPVCYKAESFAPGVIELVCYDTGKDIVNAAVKTNMKYKLDWNEESVTLRVYPDVKYPVAYWVVADKAGNVTSGRLP